MSKSRLAMIGAAVLGATVPLWSFSLELGTGSAFDLKRDRVAFTGLTRAGQSPAPAFRTGVDVVPIDFSVVRIYWGLVRRPVRGITSKEVEVEIDGRRFAVVDLKETKPGHYAGSFAPPDEYRDGKSHEVTIHIQKFPAFKRQITFPKASPDPDVVAP